MSKVDHLTRVEETVCCMMILVVEGWTLGLSISTVYVFIHSTRLYFIVHMYYTHILLFLYDIVKDKNTK